MNLFPHIDTQATKKKLKMLMSEGAIIAHHADADGCISACWVSELGRGEKETRIPVKTQDFDFEVLVEQVRSRQVRNVITLDVNVFSQPGAIQRLSDMVPGDVFVIDDHLAAEAGIPRGVKFCNLLPPGSRSTRKDQIRPAFLFADALLRTEKPYRSGFESLMLLAGLFAESVIGIFPFEEIERSRSEERIARTLGRGINAFYILNSDANRIAELSARLQLFSSEMTSAPIGEAKLRLTQSLVFQDLVTATSELSDRVSEHAEKIDLSNPIAESDFGKLYFLEFDDDARIVNLVCSEARNKVRKGIVVTAQYWAGSLAIELRRTRNLNSPDLVEVLKRLDSSFFSALGGHPMACGATIRKGKEDIALAELFSVISDAS